MALSFTKTKFFLCFATAALVATEAKAELNLGIATVDLGGTPDVSVNLGGVGAEVDLGGSGDGNLVSANFNVGASVGADVNIGTGTAQANVAIGTSPETSNPQTDLVTAARSGNLDAFPVPVDLQAYIGRVVYSRDGQVLGIIQLADYTGTGRQVDILLQVNTRVGVTSPIVILRMDRIDTHLDGLRSNMTVDQFRAQFA